MSALFLSLLLSAVPCYQATDATPGWKQVALPDDARSLAAPEGVLQFRSDEPVTVIDERPTAAWLGKHGTGKTGFDFTLSPGARSLEIRFIEPLRGAKVDVTGFDEKRQGIALMREQRVGGTTLNLNWGAAEVKTVEVWVHDHLRREPVVASWKAVSQLQANRLALSQTFGLKRSLYYLQPPGQVVRLCDEPNRMLFVTPQSPSPTEEPIPTAVKRVTAD